MAHLRYSWWQDIAFLPARWCHLGCRCPGYRLLRLRLALWLQLSDRPPTHNDKFREDGWVDIVTVVVIWAYSIGVTIIIAIVYYVLNKITWLDELGRKDRNTKNPAIENMIAALSKLSLEHGTDKHGTTRYILAPRAAEEEDDD